MFLNKYAIFSALISLFSTNASALVEAEIVNSYTVNSSAQNLWICGVGVENKNQYVGADNRIYYNYDRTLKGGVHASPNQVPQFGAAEALADASQISFAPEADNYFVNPLTTTNSYHEVRFTNIRAELTSLNYGAILHVDTCIEMPFSYDGNPPNSDDFLWQLDISNMISQIDLSYGTEANPMISTGVYCSADNNSVAANDITSWDEVYSVESNALNGALQSPTLDVSQYQKCVVRTSLIEQNTEGKRIRGIAERLTWKQNITSDIDIK
jgi:hypothetical protein